MLQCDFSKASEVLALEKLHENSSMLQCDFSKVSKVLHLEKLHEKELHDVALFF